MSYVMDLVASRKTANATSTKASGLLERMWIVGPTPRRLLSRYLCLFNVETLHSTAFLSFLATLMSVMGFSIFYLSPKRESAPHGKVKDNYAVFSRAGREILSSKSSQKLANCI